MRELNLIRLPDDEICVKAEKEGRIILTFDLDFGEIVSASRKKIPSVISFRLRNTRTLRVIERLEKVLKDSADVLQKGAIHMKKKVYNLSPKERRLVLQYLYDFFNNRKDVMFAYVYGSFAEDIPFSDIDVGVYVSGILEEEATLYTLNLGQMLEKDVWFPIDLRVLNFAPVSFLYFVIKGRLVYERDEDLRVRVAEHVILKYLDLKPMIKRGIKEAFVP